jgi:hypothetical protein
MMKYRYYYDANTGDIISMITRKYANPNKSDFLDSDLRVDITRYRVDVAESQLVPRDEI